MGSVVNVLIVAAGNRRVRSALALALVTLGAALISVSAPTAANAPGPWANIYTVHPDGTHLTRLTHGLSEEDLTSDPSWAPDGRTLVFTSGEEPAYISSITLKGLRRTILGGGKLTGFRPKLSPTGRQLLFLASRGGIYVARADGTHPHPLRAGHWSYDAPSWSPSGKLILFLAQKRTLWHIFVMDTRSHRLRQLTHSRTSEADPAWSPDGRRIAFARQVHGRWQLFVMTREGTDLQRLPTGKGSVTQPTWAPDGRRIAYVVQRGDSTAIWVLDLRTRKAHPLTGPGALASQPSWDPRGSLIAFVAKRKP